MTQNERFERLLNRPTTIEARKALKLATEAYSIWQRKSPGYFGPQYDDFQKKDQTAYGACWGIVCEDVDEHLRLASFFNANYRTPSTQKFLAQILKDKSRAREGEKEREEAEKQQRTKAE